MNPVVATILAWFLYFIFGLVKALTNNEKFDLKKVAKSVLWAIIVMIIALWLKLPPEIVISEEASLLEQILLIIESVGGLSFLMYVIDKIAGIITGFKAYLERTYNVSAAKPAG